MSNKTYMLYNELEFTCNGDISKYIPAKTNAPIDQCYPAEGGELENFTVCLGNVDITMLLDPKTIESLQEQFLESWSEDQEALDEPEERDE